MYMPLKIIARSLTTQIFVFANTKKAIHFYGQSKVGELIQIVLQVFAFVIANCLQQCI